MSKQTVNQKPAQKTGDKAELPAERESRVHELRAGQEYYCEWYCSNGEWWAGNTHAPPGYYCPAKPLYYPEPCNAGNTCTEDPIPTYGYGGFARSVDQAASRVEANAAAASPGPLLPQSARLAAAAAASPDEIASAQECCAPAAIEGFCCQYTYEHGRFWLRESSVPAGYYCPPDPIAFAKAHGYLLTLPAPRAICQALSHKPDHS